MSRPIYVVPYNTKWKEQFRELAIPIRQAMGDTALRIDHVGSTSIEGIAAKPVIDIQISVAQFEPFDAILDPLSSLGYVWHEDNVDTSKRYFREAPNMEQEIHIHVRRFGSWAEQFNLLFRDYLRANHQDRDRYGALKLELAQQFKDDRLSYIEGKDDLIWKIMRRAHDWTWYEGWSVGLSDA